jgi:2-methylcitrate dehydratase
MTAGCLAVADALNADGKQTLLAIIAAYEVYTGLADQVALRGLGWDQGVFAVLGTAAGAGLLLGLNVDQMGDALAIAITASVPTRQTRSGELAMWKGCATAAAVRSGVFAALLAHAGITGPTAAFEGRHGVWEQVTGKFTLGALGGEGRPFGIERTNLKFFPSEYHSQAPMWMALNLRKQVRVEDIDAINVQTYHICYSEIGSEPEKWQPKTRETADHSLPYLLSLGLMDGAIRVDSFSAARMRDPATLALMQKIKIAESAEFTRQFPGALITEIEVLTRQGARLVERASYPRGHAKNPMTEEDIESKFKILADNVMKPGARDALLAALWSVDQAAQIGRVLELVRVER